MISLIIKRLVHAHQAKRLAKEKLKRQAHNKEQVKLILKGLEERGY